MQTKVFADLTTSNASARREADAPSLAAPVELALQDLHLVGGGGAPRGGWLSTSDATIATTDTTAEAPRGGWL